MLHSILCSLLFRVTPFYIFYSFLCNSAMYFIFYTLFSSILQLHHVFYIPFSTTSPLHFYVICFIIILLFWYTIFYFFIWHNFDCFRYFICSFFIFSLLYLVATLQILIRSFDLYSLHCSNSHFYVISF